MLNIINVGFEHSVKVAIDGHEMVVVANDAGFVEPYTTHVSVAAPSLHTALPAPKPSEPIELTDTA